MSITSYCASALPSTVIAKYILVYFGNSIVCLSVCTPAISARCVLISTEMNGLQSFDYMHTCGRDNFEIGYFRNFQTSDYLDLVAWHKKTYEARL